MPSNDYVPRTDAGLRDWVLAFKALTGADPFRYGLVPGDAATIAEYVDAFVAALLLATDLTTRTAVTIADKDSKKMAMLGTLRPYAQRISDNYGVSVDDKVALGIRVKKLTRTPIPVPESTPVLMVINAPDRGQHIVRFHDSVAPDDRFKPFGAEQMLLFVAIGAAATTDPANAKFYGVVTEQPYRVVFDVADSGKVATYFGRWTNQRGDPSGWSGPVSLVISF